MGAGVEIASCCDIRLAADTATFGAPIARLGFPMADKEARLVARAVGDLTAREMLLSAAALGAGEMKARGFLNHVMPEPQLAGCVTETLTRMARLAPQAARMNKRQLRGDPAGYDWADSAEHREGIAAFLEKRKATF